ncbi:BamA/TamA family outer membrane protein [Candidatus Latescibacterota bacterium]
MAKQLLMAFTVCLLVLHGGEAGAAIERRQSDNYSIPVNQASQIHFKDISHAELMYRGVQGAETITIKFTRKVKASSEMACLELLEDISLDTVTSGDHITVQLFHPKMSSSGILNNMFKRKEWNVDLDITGPQDININIDTSFSTLQFNDTAGVLSCKNDFSSLSSRNHTGHFVATGAFSEINARGLDGTFNVKTEFGGGNIRVARLGGDSSVKSSFGSIDVSLPRGTGAKFLVNKNWSDVKFNISGDLISRGSNEKERILNDGGPLVQISSDFGAIKIRDNLLESGGDRLSPYNPDAVMPLGARSSWEYVSDDDRLTLTVKRNNRRNNYRIATLSFDKKDKGPFDSIDVYESKEGLFVAGINGGFFGRDMSGIRFDPPRLWLPYSDSGDAASGDSLLGSARIIGTSRSDTDADAASGIQYTMNTDGHTQYELTLVPGVGITSFGSSLKMVDYNLRGVLARKPAIAREEREEIPQFEEGEITSIAIRGMRYIPKKDVEKMLELEKGRQYTRKEIDEAVDKLAGKHRFINNTSYTIDVNGNLRVRVSEAELYSWDWDGYGSFSRVGGLGLGPWLTIDSLVGPFSEINGGAQYHWGNQEWTFNANVEKRFFKKNRFAIGATYRLDYETNMDWAIPKNDAYLNSFVLGLDTTNYYQVEGATGYITQSIGKLLDVKAEYFEEEFDSLKKHTNWSFFNARHKKEDNPFLTPGSVGSISGVRLTADISGSNSYSNASLILSAEKSYDRHADSLPEYTRYFANATYTSRIPYRSLFKIRIAGGFSDDALPEQRSFKLGGLNTLRGFEYGSVPRLPDAFEGFKSHGGGNRMFLANFDYFLNDSDDVSFVLFADVGGVWIKGINVSSKDIRRDVGIGFVLEGDMFDLQDRRSNDVIEGLRINWAVPVGPEKHVSRWTVNFVRAY